MDLWRELGNIDKSANRDKPQSLILEVGYFWKSWHFAISSIDDMDKHFNKIKKRPEFTHLRVLSKEKNLSSTDLHMLLGEAHSSRVYDARGATIST